MINGTSAYVNNDYERAAMIIKCMEEGEVMEGIIIDHMEYGSYIEVARGVQGLLRNSDFSTDGTPVSTIYRKYAPIRVKYLRQTKEGTLLFKPEKIYEGTRNIRFSNHKCYQGTVSGVFPDKVFVTLAPGMDCLCSVSNRVNYVKEGNEVVVDVSSAKKTRNGLKFRGVVVNTIDRY